MTVAIANYNGGQFLARTIESVLEQTVDDLEVIVIDNASSDSSVEIASSFVDPRLTVAPFQDFVSVTQNWNRGLEAGTGVYHALLHSDDVWYPTFLERALAELALDDQAAAVIGNARVIDAEDHEIIRATFEARRRTRAGRMPEYEYPLLLRQMDVYPCSWLARRELLKPYRFDEEFVRAPDWDFWLRVFSNEVVVCAPDAWSGYRIHATNDTFNPATLEGMRGDELKIVTAAVKRRPVSRIDERRARQMIDVRTSIRCAQVAARGEVKVALRLARATIKTAGVAHFVRGWLGLVKLPETRLAVQDLLRKVRRRG